MELYRLVETDEERRSLAAQMLFVLRDEQAEADAALGAKVRAVWDTLQANVPAIAVARDYIVAYRLLNTVTDAIRKEEAIAAALAAEKDGVMPNEAKATTFEIHTDRWPTAMALLQDAALGKAVRAVCTADGFKVLKADFMIRLLEAIAAALEKKRSDSSG